MEWQKNTSENTCPVTGLHTGEETFGCFKLIARIFHAGMRVTK